MSFSEGIQSIHPMKGQDPVGIYLSKLAIETLEQGVKYVQS